MLHNAPHDAGDCGMPPVKASCRSQRLIKRAEDHREHKLEGAMELSMGSAKTWECSDTAVATHGWASCNSRARPAPRNIAASLLTFQATELGQTARE